MVEIEGPPYIDMDICLSGLLQNSGICWDATRGSSVGAFLHAVVVTGTDNVAVLAIGKKKKRPAVRCNQPTNQGSSPGFGLPVFGPINSAHRHIVATLSPHRTWSSFVANPKWRLVIQSHRTSMSHPQSFIRPAHKNKTNPAAHLVMACSWLSFSEFLPPHSTAAAVQGLPEAVNAFRLPIPSCMRPFCLAGRLQIIFSKRVSAATSNFLVPYVCCILNELSGLHNRYRGYRLSHHTTTAPLNSPSQASMLS